MLASLYQVCVNKSIYSNSSVFEKDKLTICVLYILPWNKFFAHTSDFGCLAMS
jgi:hypothetical protein